MRILLVNRNWEFHGDKSGYELLATWLPDALRARTVTLPYRLAKAIAGSARHINYTSASLSREIGAVIDMVRYQPDIVHVLYGDMDFHYLGYFKILAPKTKLVATIHHPPAELKRRLIKSSKRFLKTLDMVICMGKNQIDYLESYVGKGKVRWIPHGIDFNYYYNKQQGDRNRQHVLIVGVSHRDIKTLRKALIELKKRYPELRCTAVIPPDNRTELIDLNWIDFPEGKIDNLELLNLYYQVTCTLLILNDCTASNTLLESIATGCPLIVSDVGGVRDYVDENSAIFVRPGKVQDIILATEKIFEDPLLSSSLSEKASNRAKLFDWPKIALKTIALYKEVVSK